MSTLATNSSAPSLAKMWLLAFRPKTLTAALAPIVVATAFVSWAGYEVHSWISWCALLSSFCLQIGTNLVNDAADFKKGADTSERLGPQRVTQSGIFTYKQVMIMAAVFFLAAALFGVPLVFQGGFPILVVGIFSILFGYAYTTGPFPLAYRGWGDFFVLVFFGWIATAGMVYLQTHDFSWRAILLGTQIGLLATVLIAINNLRDIEGDTKVNKKTLPVRWGKTFARREIAVLILLPFLLNTLWIWDGAVWAGILPFAVLPLGIKIIRQISVTEPSEKYNQFLGQAAGLHLIFGLLLAVGFWLKG